MPVTSQIVEAPIRAIEVDGRRYAASIVIEDDGVEHIGHLWFHDEEWEDEGVRDHGSISGRSASEVIEHATALTVNDLTLRFHRAQVDSRRNHGLRRVTDQILESIRHLNRVSTSMRAGLLELDDAAAEIDSTEKRLYALIGQLRVHAGVAA